ncbi:MAG: M1 family metallopeptidase [Candidatus Zixiibacteriota bacterium]
MVPAFCKTEDQHAFPIASYRIEVTLDTLEKKLKGNEYIVFVNTSTRSIDTLYLHLYPNAFRSDTTALMRESMFPDRIKREEKYRGGVEIERVNLDSDLDWSDKKIVQETIMKLPLPQMLSPAETLGVKIKFTVKLPQIVMRLGYSDRDYMIGQWFPKMAVLQKDGTWNAHRYHSNSEFFADFGTYDISITVPAQYVVGATGHLTDEKENADSTKTLVFRAEDVHDFVWVASPNFQIYKRMVDGIEVNFLCKPEHAKEAERILDEAEFAFKYYNSSYGVYPYSNFTIADIKIGLGGGAMEYPMFITISLSDLPPDKVNLDAMVIYHEIAHQWWYGMVASNEFEEAWLDEGFATYSENRIMEKRFGLKANLVNLWGLSFSDENLTKLSYLLDPQSDPVVKNSWEFMDYLSYRAGVYSKASLFLETLGNYVGQDRMSELLREYFQRHKFKHPTTGDFIRLTNEVTGEDFTSLFEQILFGTGICDYEVASIKSEPKTSDQAKGPFRTEVMLKRLGEVIMPVDVLIVLDDGEKIRQNWDGKERWYRIEMETNSRIKTAVVDFEDKLTLDINVNNNSLTTEAEDSVILKLFTQSLFWFEWLVHFVTSY